MVLLSARGYGVPRIAAIHACGQDIVRLWLHHYEHQGVAGLDDAPRGGRPPADVARRGRARGPRSQGWPITTSACAALRPARSAPSSPGWPAGPDVGGTTQVRIASPTTMSAC